MAQTSPQTDMATPRPTRPSGAELVKILFKGSKQVFVEGCSPQELEFGLLCCLDKNVHQIGLANNPQVHLDLFLDIL